jgi:uncharacterized membrane protein YfcA
LDLWQLLIFGVLGIIGGLLSGLAGVGGGVFFVPALMYVAGWNIKDAVAASLVIIIFSALSGTLRNVRSSENPINWNVTALLSATVAPCALIGVAISRVSPDRFVEIAFAVLLLGIAYPTARGRSRSSGTGRKIPTALVLIAGAGIGALSGLVGVGGGVLMVPLMMLGLGLRPKVAIPTSLAVTFFTGIVGATGYVMTGFDRLSSVPPLIVGSIVGAWISVRLRDRTPDKILRIGFALLMVIVALRLIFE